MAMLSADLHSAGLQRQYALTQSGAVFILEMIGASNPHG
jgi:hypothetical protein